jgi:hypothetical protein
MNRTDKKAFKEAADSFLDSIQEEVSSCLILGDVGRLDRLVQIVHIHLDSELMDALRNKGFSKEIEALADKAGKIQSLTVNSEKTVKA